MYVLLKKRFEYYTFDIIVLVLDVQVRLYALITCYNLPHKKVLLMFLISSTT